MASTLSAAETAGGSQAHGMDRRRFLLTQASLVVLTGGAVSYAGVGLAAPALDLDDRVTRLEAAVSRAEDIRALKRLQRSYSNYLELGLWKDLIELFDENAVGDYPAGVFKTRKMLWPHFFNNNGRGILGVENGRIMPHISFQPVVTLSPDGKTGYGRWKIFAMLGNLNGAGSASWNGAIYENKFAKVDGVWKIVDLHFHSEWGGGYDVGWTNVRAPAPREPGAAPPPRAARATPAAAPAAGGAAPAAAPAGGAFSRLAQPSVRPHNEACEGYAVKCVFPYSFASGVVGRPIPALWAPGDAAPSGDAGAKFADLMQRIERLNDEAAVVSLNNLYGHHTDAKEWDQVAALFADDGTLELGQQGVYVGRARVRKALELDGAQGLSPGEVNDHMDFGPLVTVGPDGKTAKARGVSLWFLGKDGKGQVQQGIYENSFTKTGSGWKIASIHYYPRMISDAAKGWGKDGQQPRGPSAGFPPDRGPSEAYEIYPKGYFPPLHYVNPVTQKPSQYPDGAPAQKFDAAVIAFSATKPAAAKPVSRATAQARIAAAEVALERAVAFDAAENVISAYGYYTDEKDTASMDNILARNPTIMLAGDASGPGQGGQFLKAKFGDDGQPAGTMMNHLVFQPVIRVSADAKSASVHARLFEMTGVAQGAATWGAGVYDDTLVREDGVWKLKSIRLTRTWGSTFKDGWTKAVVADNGRAGGSGRARTRTRQ